MRTIRQLITNERPVYILMKTKAMQYRFMSDAEREGITYSDQVKATERLVQPVMLLKPDGTIRFIGWAGYMYLEHNKEKEIYIDYEKYIDGAEDYLI